MVLCNFISLTIIFPVCLQSLHPPIHTTLFTFLPVMAHHPVGQPLILFPSRSLTGCQPSSHTATTSYCSTTMAGACLGFPVPFVYLNPPTVIIVSPVLHAGYGHRDQNAEERLLSTPSTNPVRVKGMKWKLLLNLIKCVRVSCHMGLHPASLEPP